MSRLIFGRDRMPVEEKPPSAVECKPGKHLVDDSLARCTECFWLDPLVDRCETEGCIYPADYEVDVADKGDTTFKNPIRSAKFCGTHALLGGMALVPGGDV